MDRNRGQGCSWETLPEQPHLDFDLGHAVMRFVPLPGPVTPQLPLSHKDIFYMFIVWFEKLSQRS